MEINHATTIFVDSKLCFFDYKNERLLVFDDDGLSEDSVLAKKVKEHFDNKKPSNPVLPEEVKQAFAESLKKHQLEKARIEERINGIRN